MIIAITGPVGAGKDTASEYIGKILQLKHVSGGDILREMLTSIGLEPKKSALGDFGTFIRTHYGADAIIKRVLTKAASDHDIVNSGVRSYAEAQLIKNAGGRIIYIDAPAKIRHERLAIRQKSNELVDTESLQKIDMREKGSDNPLDENLTAIMAIADHIIINDTDLSGFYKKLNDIIVGHAHKNT